MASAASRPSRRGARRRARRASSPRRSGSPGCCSCSATPLTQVSDRRTCGESQARTCGRRSLGPCAGTLSARCGSACFRDTSPRRRRCRWCAGRIRVADQIARRPGCCCPSRSATTSTPRHRREPHCPLCTPSDARRSAGSGRHARPAGSPGRAARRCYAAGARRATPRLASVPAQPRYHAALRLAELVLRHQSFEVGAGGLRVAAFVVDMAKVFEDFVATALAESWAPRPGHTQMQHPTQLDQAGGVRMRVDVVHLSRRCTMHRRRRQVQARIWQRTVPECRPLPDARLRTALQVPVAWLVYASGSHGPVTRRVRNTDIPIVEYPLDLSASPADLLGQIGVLAEEAWRRCPLLVHA